MGLEIFLVLVSTKIPLLTELAELDAFENLPRSRLTLFAGEFIFNGVKPVLLDTIKHPISKYVGVLKARGLCSEDLVNAIRGIQRGLGSMAAGQGEAARNVLDRIRAKHKIPFPKI